MHILTDMMWGVADIFLKADTIHSVANRMLSVAVIMYCVVNLMGRPGSAGINIFKNFK